MNKIILKCEEIKEHLPKNNSNIEKRLEEL